MKFSICFSNPFDAGLGLIESLKPLCDDLPSKIDIAKFLNGISINDGNKYILVAWREDLVQVIGTATLIFDEKIIHNLGVAARIEDVSVDENFQGEGVGKALIEKCIEISKLCHAYKVILHCNPKNIKFYEKCGFTKKEDAVMRLDL